MSGDGWMIDQNYRTHKMKLFYPIFALALLSVSCVSDPIPVDFTIIALPDTQNYVSYAGGGTPELFEAQTRWIVENRDSLNIVFVTHLGDFVQNGDEIEAEWIAAERAMSFLEDPKATGLPDGIPYGIVVGNHDQSPFGDADGSTAGYNRRMGIGRFAGRSYFGDHYGSNYDNHFELFSASGYDFVFLHLEYDTNQDPAVLAWADSVLSVYSHRFAMLSTHYLVGVGNPASFGEQGQEIYEALKRHSKLIMMFGGHIAGDGGEGQRTDIFEEGVVHSLLSDYQNYENGGDGWLRIMRFSPSQNTVTVTTYSPTVNSGEGGFLADENSDFELSVSFSLEN